MFHAKDGLHFDRDLDGSVKIIKKNLSGNRTIWEIKIDPDTWASIVASMCIVGENEYTFNIMRFFHSHGHSHLS